MLALAGLIPSGPIRTSAGSRGDGTGCTRGDDNGMLYAAGIHPELVFEAWRPARQVRRDSKGPRCRGCGLAHAGDADDRRPIEGLVYLCAENKVVGAVEARREHIVYLAIIRPAEQERGSADHQPSRRHRPPARHRADRALRLGGARGDLTRARVRSAGPAIARRTGPPKPRIAPSPATGKVICSSAPATHTHRDARRAAQSVHDAGEAEETGLGVGRAGSGPEDRQATRGSQGTR